MRHTTASRTLRRGAARLQQHVIAVGLVVAAVSGVLAWVAWSSVNGVPLQRRYELHVVISHTAPILKAGDAVRISGRLAGIVQKVEPYRGERRATVSIRAQYAPIGADARTRVTVRSFLYLTYLEIFPGHRSDPLPDGATIALSRSAHGTDLLQVAQLFDRRARATLHTALLNTGLGLAGRGAELNQALADLPAAAQDGTRELQALTRRPEAIGRGIAGAARVVRGARGERPDDVGALLGAGATVLGAVAAGHAALASALDQARGVEDAYLADQPLIDPMLDDADGLVRDLRPAVRALSAALADLNRVLAKGATLRRDVHRLTGELRPVLKGAIPVLRGLRITVASIEPLLQGLNALVDATTPYSADITRAGKALVSLTTKRYPDGLTAPDNPALRFTPIFTPAACRDPYPEPGAALAHSGTC